jgi:hypothetical protein
VLLVLVERRGELVPRQDLMSAVWPDTFVEESNLSSNISILRRYLGAAPDGGNYIQTIPKRGYRFAAAVKLVQDEPPVPLTGEDVPRGVSPTVEPESDGAGQAAGLKEAGTGGTTATESKNKRAVPQGTVLVAAAVLLGLVLALAYRQVWRWRMPGSGPKAHIDAIAVLPLENLSGEPSILRAPWSVSVTHRFLRPG